MLGLLSAITAVSASNAPSISAAYSTVVDMHISEIMPLFLSDELNPEWSPTLESHQQIYTRDQGYLAHQQYKMPWPMAPRDVLLSCERKANAREGVLLSECHSVEHEAAPIKDGVVRLILSSTRWRIEALPDERTRLSLDLEMPASMTVGVPKYVVKYCQRSSLRDSVTQLIAAAKRLRLPPHESYLKWRRTRQQVASATRRSPPTGVGASASRLLLAWSAEVASSSATGAAAVVLAAAAALLTLHAIAFACLARLWRTRSSRRRRRRTELELLGGDCAKVVLDEGSRPPSPTSVVD